ncbi:MAG: aspartate--tRNA ligase [Anaerolineae bacterium]|nr:aspartate--tRNA ligase [Anaerolineae bacterium]NUQ02633.1 aspartate--tRNA ligase [Anaerolineae bacterium]
MLKTHHCGELRLEHVGQHVSVAGWVHRRRDQGGLIFLDLRDRSGIVQVRIDEQDQPAAHAAGSSLRSEFVVQVIGTVVARPEGTANPELPTGEVEVVPESVVVLNASKVPPFLVNREDVVDEEAKMRFRYLYLRRPNVQKNIILRHQVVKFIRDYLDERGFVEIETPILFKTTPEGARDFLVPSRLNPGTFYALPQSPQQLKQLLMVAGYERYFQIARCFRDEDLRGNRQPEFTQLDLEMSFVQRDDVMALIEGLMTTMANKFVPEKQLLTRPFQRLTYTEVMEKYGSDKPDLRYDLAAVDVTDIAGKSGFPIFVQNAGEGKPIKAIRVPKMGANSGMQLRKETANLEDLVRTVGAKGLAWMAIPEKEDEEVKGPIGKYFTVDQKLELFARVGIQPGDLVLFTSDQRDIVYAVVDTLRRHLAEKLELADPNVLAFAWVIDFPLFFWSEEEQRWDPSQHMFTMPVPEDVPYLDSDPGKARGSQYDLICNGQEVAGGSIRIHERAVQEKIFPLIGQTMERAKEQFGHMLEAFEYGTPPHGGIASGIDRLIMVLSGETNIREVMAFPKTQNGADLMAGAPSPAEARQLADLFIRVVEPAKKS